MSPAERTLADVFGDAGYHTAYTGKWHLAGIHRYNFHEADVNRGVLQNRTPIHPDLQGGFDDWRGFELRNGPFDTVYFENDDPTPQPVPGYQTNGLFDIALDRMTDRKEPFFHVVSVEAPHPPFTAPREDLERWQSRDITYRPNVNPETPGNRTWSPEDPRPELEMTDGLADDLRAYYAMVENLDANVGRLLETLERRGRRGNTAIVFISDHGELLGSHGLTEKQYPYEESIGVPFLISHPGGGIDGGKCVAEPTCTEDWFPTICGLAGIDPGDTPGRNVTDLARGEQGALDRPGVRLEFVAENRPEHHFAETPWRGFRTERYKYTVKGGPTGAEPWQLFDLRDDPYEQHNLVDDADFEDVASRLHGHLREQLADSTDTFRLAPAFGHEGVGIVA
jgi:arylsulfatase A-like enzyme